MGRIERDRKRDNESDGNGFHNVQECPEGGHSEPIADLRRQCRDPGPGGHLGEEVEPVDVGGNWSRENDGDSIGDDGREFWMDGATSGARLDMKTLATAQVDQHGQQERKPANAPEPSTPSHMHPIRHASHPNPPRRRGKLKTSSRNISQT